MHLNRQEPEDSVESTGYGLDNRGDVVQFAPRQEVFLSSKMSRLCVSTEPPTLNYGA
jgi:hypothetical protein